MNSPKLTDRDLKILGFLARYRAATDYHIRRHAFHSTSGRNAERVMRRLEKHQFVKQVRCGDQLKYFALTRRAFRLLGLRPRTVRSLTEQSLPVVLAITSYCVANGARAKDASRVPRRISGTLSSRPSVIQLRRRGPRDESQTCFANGGPRRRRPSHPISRPPRRWTTDSTARL